MADLLLELYSEEIPARMQKNAELQYKQILEKYFARHNIDYHNIEISSGPCRITIISSGINSKIKILSQKIKGPNVTASSNATNGFCTKYNISKTDLTTEIIDGREYYFYDSPGYEVQTKDILIDILPKVISSHIWPKSMKWGSYNISYVRPLRNILCLFDNKILKFNYGHLESNDITFGHKFLSSSFKVMDIASYKKILEERYVILGRNTRKKIILDQISECLDDKYEAVINDRLLEEVIGLIEYPKILVGKIDKKFLSLPIEVIKLTLEIHQKYFIVIEKTPEKIGESTNNLVDKFVFVANSPNHGEKVVSGNEKVLEARLSDAAYFYQLDLETKITDYLSKLKQVIFHSKLGSMFDKTNRLMELVKFIKMSLKINDKDAYNLEQAAKICKCDLVSNLVNELPELQGIIGKYYAQNAKLDDEISEAISLHYKPTTIDDQAPEGISALLALIDKTDSLVGLYIAGERATSTKDPYSLRRYAIGIIKIILHNKLDINLKEFFEYSVKIYNQDKIDAKIIDGLLAFLYDRFKNLLYSNYDKQLVNACYSEDILLCFERVKIFSNYDMLTSIISAYKRACNICNDITDKNIDVSLFNTKYEKQLMEVIDSSNLLNNTTEQALDLCLQLSEKLNLLLDNVYINDENNDTKLINNRMALIYSSINIFDRFAKWRFFL